MRTERPERSRGQASDAVQPLDAQPPAMAILVVDDDPGMRSLLQDFLAEEGYSVDTARDGSEALTRLSSRMPGLVLLDLNMPRMDGIELFAHLRARELGVPVVFMSAGDRPQRVAERYGAADWLAKPFTLEALLTVVRRQTGTAPGR